MALSNLDVSHLYNNEDLSDCVLRVVTETEGVKKLKINEFNEEK